MIEQIHTAERNNLIITTKNRLDNDELERDDISHYIESYNALVRIEPNIQATVFFAYKFCYFHYCSP